VPRILSIVFIAFLVMFSLDEFRPGSGFWEIAVGLFMHNIPVFILIAALVVAWKRELVGAIVFVLAGLLYIVFAFNRAGNSWLALAWIAMISVPAFIIGGLFFAGWMKKKNV